MAGERARLDKDSLGRGQGVVDRIWLPRVRIMFGKLADRQPEVGSRVPAAGHGHRAGHFTADWTMFRDFRSLFY